MTDFHSFFDTNRRTSFHVMSAVFERPDDVLNDPQMSPAEKRALLASWASDAHAIPGVPSLRLLEHGSVIEVDEILHALKSLDAREHATAPDRPAMSRQAPFQRRREPRFRIWPRIVRRHRRNDDDDPPPCPAYAAVPPKGGGSPALPTQRRRWPERAPPPLPATIAEGGP